MIAVVRVSLFTLLLVLISCDGPNTEAEVQVLDRGVHNQDGFQVELKVNNGASITPDTAVAIQISAVNAEEMYVTQESACNIGGTWESYKTFKQWTLQKTNQMNFFYVKFRNNDRESDCAFTSIEHDSIAPAVQLTLPADGSTLVNPSELLLVGTCSEDSTISIKVNAVITFTTSCLGNTWTKSLDTTALPPGTITIQLKANDQVMNTSPPQNLTFTK